MADEPHAAAILALLEANPMIPAVYDDEVPQGAPTAYVKVYLFDGPGAGSEKVTMDTADVYFRIICHCVGQTPAGARLTAMHVKTSLLDVVPVIAGRSCWPIRYVMSRPPQRDETTGVLIQDQVVEYTLHTKAT